MHVRFVRGSSRSLTFSSTLSIRYGMKNSPKSFHFVIPRSNEATVGRPTVPNSLPSRDPSSRVRLESGASSQASFADASVDEVQRSNASTRHRSLLHFPLAFHTFSTREASADTNPTDHFLRRSRVTSAVCARRVSIESSIPLDCGSSWFLGTHAFRFGGQARELRHERSFTNLRRHARLGRRSGSDAPTRWDGKTGHKSGRKRA